MNTIQKVIYPQALIRELTADIDQSLIAFFHKKQDEAGFYTDFTEMCTDAWVGVVKGKTNQSELLKIRRSFLFQRNRKKKRWRQSIETGMEQLALDDKRHPFAFVMSAMKVLSSEQWEALYGNLSVRDIVAKKMEETLAWADDAESLMISCPALNSFTVKQQRDALLSDVVMRMFEAADVKFDLKLNEFTEAFIDEMGKAYFSPDGRRKYDRPAYGPLEQEIPLSETGEDKLFVSISQEAFGADALSTSMFDEKDRKLLMYIIRVAADSATNSKIAIPVNSLAKAVRGKKASGNVSSREGQDIARRLYKCAGTTFYRYENGRQIAAINFIGSVEGPIVRNGQAQFDITLGPILSDAIIKDQIRRLPSSTFDRISSPTGRLMLLGLQKERIIAFSRYRRGLAKELVTSFSYSNFLAMVRFKTGNKSKNWKIIKDTLDEFRQKGVFIDHVLYDNVSRIALVYWLMPDEDEQKDLALFGYQAILDNTEQ